MRDSRCNSPAPSYHTATAQPPAYDPNDGPNLRSIFAAAIAYAHATELPPYESRPPPPSNDASAEVPARPRPVYDSHPRTIMNSIDSTHINIAHSENHPRSPDAQAATAEAEAIVANARTVIADTQAARTLALAPTQGFARRVRQTRYPSIGSLEAGEYGFFRAGRRGQNLAVYYGVLTLILLCVVGVGVAVSETNKHKCDPEDHWWQC